MLKYIYLIFIFTMGIYADVNLSGVQSGDFPFDIYSIEKDIIVEKDKVLSFEKGTVLKFNEFTGVKVYGKLICKGERDEPVKFTSANDSIQWNGIEVFEDGKIEFGDVIVEKSLSGISITDSSNIEEFEDIVLYKNDENIIKIGDKEIILKDDKPFSIEIENLNIYASNGLIPTTQGLVKEKKSVGIIIARYCFAGIALGGLATWVHYKESAEHYATKYKYDQTSAADDYRIKHDEHNKISDIGRAITLASLPVLAFTITIDDRVIKRIKNRKKK